MDHVNTKEYLLKAVPLSFAFDGFFEIVPMTRSASEARSNAFSRSVPVY